MKNGEKVKKEATLVSLKLRVLERKYILGYMLHFPPMYLYIIMYILLRHWRKMRPSHWSTTRRQYVNPGLLLVGAPPAKKKTDNFLIGRQKGFPRL